MKTYEKIRLLRELNHWSQEEMTSKLELSPNGYAKIERGETRLNIPRLEQIAAIFNTDIFDLMQQDDKRLVYQINNEGNNNNDVTFQSSSHELSAEIEKLNLRLSDQNDLIASKEALIRQQEIELKNLRDMLDILKKQLGS